MRPIPTFSKSKRAERMPARQVLDRGVPLCSGCLDYGFLGDSRDADHSWLGLWPLFEQGRIQLCSCEAAALWQDFMNHPEAGARRSK
jgi:hypothetical protein